MKGGLTLTWPSAILSQRERGRRTEQNSLSLWERAGVRATHLLAAVSLVILFPLAVSAADLSISAQVDKSIVALDEQVRLDVAVSGPSTSLPEPRLPSIPNFSVNPVGTTQNINMVNGKVESSLVYSYVLVPRFVGKAVIEPITAEQDGKTAQTDPIEIQVVRANNATNSPQPVAGQPINPQGRPQPQNNPRQPEVFMEASVDKHKVFVNEQLTLTVRFYQGVQLLGNPDYNPPDTTGFYAEELPQAQYHKNIHGRDFGVTELHVALFPTTAGKKTISRGVVRAQVPQAMNLDPYASDFFQKFFAFGGQQAKTIEVHSDPIEIEVEPLPEAGKPKDFDGAVGLYNLSAIATKPDLKVGDALDLNLSIEGEGNLKTVFAPKLPDMPAWRVYDTIASVAEKKDGGIIRGTKTFKTILVPRASGNLTIPKLSFSFFDPQTRSYRTRTVGPIPLKVEASTEAASSLPSGAGTLRGPVAVESDIQFIHDYTSRKPWTDLLGLIGRAGLLNALPGIFLAGCGVLFGIREYRMRMDPRIIRFQEALQAAQKRLSEARGHGGEPDRAVPVLGDTLARYIADKLGTSPNGLTLKQSLALLKDHAPQLPDERLQELQSIWNELDSLRYAPMKSSDGNGAIKELAHRMEALFDLLEKEIRR